jgi:two-component system sensor histidine kinase VicK
MRQGFMGLNVERLAFNQLLKEVVQRVRLTASTHTFLLHPDPALPEIEGDRDKLIQVIMNLLTNAVKYAPEGGEITVTSYAEEQGIHLCIEDQGMGIPEDSLEKIFTPYHRVNGARTQYIQGTGLGLPIVRQIAQMHGGWVWAESIVGKGSTFHVTLPFRVPVSSTPIE